ncbi:MAG: hypothetical protein ABIZ80_13625 [Bryobacteraceae bacterium]
MLEEFRALVRAGVLRVTPENEVLPAGDVPAAAHAQEQPQSRISSEDQMNLLDQELVDWLARRRESKLEEPAGQPHAQPLVAPRAGKAATGFRSKVVDLLAQRILERWDHAERDGERDRLRNEVIARVAETALQRWDRELD